MNPFLGKFITLEGIEGMGKSTQLAHILAYLKQKNIDVIVTREPGGTPVAESLRKILLTDSIEPIVPKTELLIFYAARLQHYEAKIKPALEKGSWVISDRFYDATFAYQGGGRELGFEMILPLHQWVLGGFSPDLTFLFDGSAELSMARIQARNQEQDSKKDRIEKEKKAFFERTRQAYLVLASQEPTRFSMIDASQSVMEIKKTIIQNLEERLGSFMPHE
jgi:dTMP kinase